MKRVFVVVLMAALVGCAIAPNYVPTTKEGANCKMTCSTNMQLCDGSSYTCDRSYAKCIDACIDIDRVNQK